MISAKGVAAVILVRGNSKVSGVVHLLRVTKFWRVRQDLPTFWLMEGHSLLRSPSARGNPETCMSWSSEISRETFYLNLATLIVKKYEIIQNCTQNKRLHEKQLFHV